MMHYEKPSAYQYRTDSVVCSIWCTYVSTNSWVCYLLYYPFQGGGRVRAQQDFFPYFFLFLESGFLTVVSITEFLHWCSTSPSRLLMRNLHRYTGISIASLRTCVSMQSGGLKELSRDIKLFVGPVRLAHLLEMDNRYWRTCDDHQPCHTVLHYVTSCENRLGLKLDTTSSTSTPLSTLSTKYMPSSLDVSSAVCCNQPIGHYNVVDV